MATLADVPNKNNNNYIYLTYYLQVLTPTAQALQVPAVVKKYEAAHFKPYVAEVQVAELAAQFTHKP